MAKRNAEVGVSRAEFSKEVGMESLIPVINKLQEVFNTTGTSSDFIQLPQIVVLGDQSSGKSSVLESLVGKPFLPRGKGIVTRCPIVFKLIHTPGSDEWCEFMHAPGKQYKNFNDVEKEIIAQTNRLAGDKFGITKDKIQLTVYSPDVVTLTLVDLPGIVKVPTADQPEDIETQIKELIMEYIEKTNTIILAVSAANNDIATSESLKLAKLVDPNKDRTLAILTKLDLGSDSSSDALTGKLFPMKLGIVGVVNRSQEDIENDKSIQDALKSEQEFLRSRYPRIANQHGTPYLAKRLNKVLMQHIEHCFPSLDMRIKELSSNYKRKLDELGSDIEMDNDEKMKTMVDILDKFAQTYKGQINGKGRCLNTSELSGGARIDYIFRNTFEKNLNLLNPLEDVTDMEIIVTVRNSRGIGNRQAITEDAFQELTKRQILKMKAICVHCANMVHQEMLRIIPTSLDPSTQRFPRVNGQITRIVNELLQSRAARSTEMIEHYIDMNASAAITSDTDFDTEMSTLVQEINVVGLGDVPVPQILKYGGADTILSMAGGQTAAADGPQNLTEEQILSCQIVKKQIESLFQIVRRQVRDQVPKSLLHFLIYYAVDNVHTTLLNRLHSPASVEELIKEAEEIAEKRINLHKELETLNKASGVLDEVRATNLL